MKIWDYESGSTLSDVEITLTVDEAQELAAYLTRLAETPAIGHAHLSEFDGPLLGRELTIAVEAQNSSLAG